MQRNRTMNDRRLVEGCIRKDPGSWSILVSKYSRLVGIAASDRLKKYGFNLPKEDIEDIRQSVFTAIWDKDKLRSVADSDNISHWLAVVSGNMAIDHVRSSKNREYLRMIPIYKKFKEKYLAELLPSRALRIEDDTVEIEMAERIDGAIEDLSCRERTIIKLYLIHGKKHEEIAYMLGLPKGTVCSCIKRARDRLKIALRDLLIIFAIFSALFTSLYI